MKGTVTIPLDDYLELQRVAQEGEAKAKEIAMQASIFRQEASLLLNFIASKYDVGLIVAEFNKQSKKCFVQIEEDKTLDIQIIV
jgi:hypothetical protein